MIKKRNFKSIVAVGVIALASATLLAACGSKSTSSKDEINWYTPTEILTLDISKKFRTLIIHLQCWSQLVSP